MSFIEDFQRGVRRNGAPVTTGIIALSIVSFLLEWTLHLGIFEAFAFSPGRFKMPWTAVTYPFASAGNGQGLFFMALTLMWVWWVGSVVERDMGSGRFAALWVAMSILAALSTAVFSFVLGVSGVVLFGLALPEAAITVMWATRYWNSIVQLMFFPIQGRWIGFLAAGSILFAYGTPVPLLGVAAALHLVLAWAIAANRIPFLPYKAGASRGFFGGTKKVATRHGIQSEGYFEDVRKREKDRKEREELRKLFERSLIEDPDDKKGRDSGS